jgi:hypothetical protein
LVGTTPLRSAAARAGDGSPGFVGSTGAGSIALGAATPAQANAPHNNIETIVPRALAVDATV